MTAYAIFIRERTTDGDALKTYGQLAGPTLAGYDAKPIVAYGPHEVLEGPDVEGVVIVEFPTMEAAKAWYDSPSYREAREHRFKGADYRGMIVQGL